MIAKEPFRKPVVIAEIGCNHRGELETALEMIRIAKMICHADVVKFQKRCVEEVLTPDEYSAPHPAPWNSYGSTYGQHREFLEFDLQTHRALVEECKKVGIEYSCSVWDQQSLKDIVSLKPSQLKIPSACNTNFELLAQCCEEFEGEIHISMGMSTPEEVNEIVCFVEERGRLADSVIYHCVSGYPIAFEDACLLEIVDLVKNYGNKALGIGFSGHHNGIAIDVAAYVLGAVYFERHYTLNRTWKGTDHAASLEPIGMRKLKRDLLNTRQALKKKPGLLDVEVPQREKLKWNRQHLEAATKK